MDYEQQQERIRSLTNKEMADRNMRYEWRKSLENGYEAQMQSQKDKDMDEQKELRTGPTSIDALGNHY